MSTDLRTRRALLELLPGTDADTGGVGVPALAALWDCPPHDAAATARTLALEGRLRRLAPYRAHPEQQRFKPARSRGVEQIAAQVKRAAAGREDRVALQRLLTYYRQHSLAAEQALSGLPAPEPTPVLWDADTAHAWTSVEIDRVIQAQELAWAARMPIAALMLGSGLWSTLWASEDHVRARRVQRTAAAAARCHALPAAQRALIHARLAWALWAAPVCRLAELQEAAGEAVRSLRSPAPPGDRRAERVVADTAVAMLHHAWGEHSRAAQVLRTALDGDLADEQERCVARTLLSRVLEEQARRTGDQDLLREAQDQARLAVLAIDPGPSAPPVRVLAWARAVGQHAGLLAAADARREAAQLLDRALEVLRGRGVYQHDRRALRAQRAEIDRVHAPTPVDTPAVGPPTRRTGRRPLATTAPATRERS
ncbi:MULTISPECIES: hypothetical protein [Actinosynnema]|uniref:hypothetical protein n=1 Tax=Actinosynnema TaxID=40566 RepID=UPI0020A57584|nr:hypothetical protein [Actinosynnema pretiosum]MCP2097417.1 hypothetical protein [Actinosynnema pretiosum]